VLYRDRGKNIVHSAALAILLPNTLDIDLNEIKGFFREGSEKRLWIIIIQKAEQHYIDILGKGLSHSIAIEVEGYARPFCLQ